MKRLLLFLVCNSHLLLNAMTEVKVKQNSLETFEARLNEELLIESVKKNDIATVKTLLDEKVNPNYVINAGETPLSIAIERGSIGMVRVLIAAHADVNKRISFQGTEHCPHKIKKITITSALILAIINQHSEIAELLIDTGAHVCAREIIYKDKELRETSTTALMCAIKYGQANIIRKLIAKGAELTDQIKLIDFSKISNKLAIKQAIALGKKERQALLEAQKKLAAEQKNETQEKKELEASSISAQLKEDLFGKAVENNDITTVKALLEENINPNKICKGYNYTPLKCAINFGHLEMVQLLIAHGADFADTEKIQINAIPDEKKLALIHAIEVGKKERRELLEAEKNLTVAKLPTEAEEKSEHALQ